MIKSKLSQYLGDQGLSGYALAKEVEKNSNYSKVTIQSIVYGTRKMSLDSLSSIIKTLRLITNKDVQVSDIIEYQ